MWFSEIARMPPARAPRRRSTGPAPHAGPPCAAVTAGRPPRHQPPQRQWRSSTPSGRCRSHRRTCSVPQRCRARTRRRRQRPSRQPRGSCAVETRSARARQSRPARVSSRADNLVRMGTSRRRWDGRAAYRVVRRGVRRRERAQGARKQSPCGRVAGLLGRLRGQEGFFAALAVVVRTAWTVIHVRVDVAVERPARIAHVHAGGPRTARGRTGRAAGTRITLALVAPLPWRNRCGVGPQPGARLTCGALGVDRDADRQVRLRSATPSPRGAAPR